jgi:polyisoprenoid-binding protein YceI
MKKILYVIAGIIVLIGAFYLYITRPVDLPQVEDNPNTSSTGSTATSSAEAWSVSRGDAKFEADETLRGNPFHVVGETSSISGDVSYDAASGVLSGLVRVDGSTIKTDSTQRDGAIARLILHTTDSDKRFITFAPKSFKDVPPDPTLNTDYTFSVTGDLTVNGITKQVTWTVTGKASPGGTITGVAKTTVKRGDYGLVIPNIPFVANVSENIALTLNFTFLKK